MRPGAGWLGVALLAAALRAFAQDVHDALRAGDLVCEFRDSFRRGLVAGLDDDPRGPDVMMVYEAVGADPAYVVQSGRTGRRAVLVRATPNAVHLIEPDGPSVRVTTLTACRERKWKNGVETCVRFAARHAWHFDAAGYLGPEIARAPIPSAAAFGVCEPWNLD